LPQATFTILTIDRRTIDPDAHKGLRMTLLLFPVIPDRSFLSAIPDHAFLPVIKTEVQKTPKG
ncbi:MAG: hypothetical protein J6N45_04575, partial [Alphaproteobacteria bacterium]|nr:hypothetical protein [Alphaproteobacteria bacterium]